jgi:hypothetical protein
MAKNKTFRKQFAVTASAAMLAGAVIPAAVAHAQLDDVVETQVSYEAVTELTAMGIIQGYADNKFHGENSVARKHAVLFLNRALKLDAPADVAGVLANLSDVSESNERYGVEVATLVSAGIFSGNTDGSFGLNTELTRQQMATILVRAFGLQANETEVTLTDLDTVSKHHIGDVKVLFQNGITTGKADGSFDPTATISRAEFSIMLYRAMQATAGTKYSVEVEAGLTTFDRLVSVAVETETPSNFEVTVDGEKLSYQASSKKFVGIVSTTKSDEDIEAGVKVVNLGGLLESVTVEAGLTTFDRVVTVKLADDASRTVTVEGKELEYQASSKAYVGIVPTTKAQEDVEVYVDGVLQTGASQPAQSETPVEEQPAEEQPTEEQPTEEQPTTGDMPAVKTVEISGGLTAFDSIVSVTLDVEDASGYTVTVLGKELRYKQDTGVFANVVNSKDEAAIKAGIVVTAK